MTTARALARWRFRGQHVWSSPLDEPVDVVRALGAMQAQEYAYAKWSIAQRMRTPSRGRVDEAIASGRILRTHVLRPTWHFVLADDLPWLLAATAPRVHAMNAPYYASFGVTPAVRAKSVDVVLRVLEETAHPTRDEIAAALAKKRLPSKGPPLAYVMMNAELEGLVASGPPRGKKQTYARLAKVAAIPRDEALATLADRYFLGHGPATVRDFAWWASLPIGEARRALATVEKRFERLESNGRTYVFAGEPPAPTRGPKRVDLVQCYDELLVGYTESRDVLFAAQGAEPRGSAPIHSVFVDAQRAGHFRATDTKRVETKLLRAFDEREKTTLARAIARFESFVRIS